tara:strand:+ start:124 stop:816 length:693 start_codon:yes stop_codon:yes gene_type:complete
MKDIPNQLVVSDVMKEMLEKVIIEGKDIDIFVEEKIETTVETSSAATMKELKKKFADDIQNKLDDTSDKKLNKCQKEYYRFFKLNMELRNLRNKFTDVKNSIIYDKNKVAKEDADNSKNIHQMKALYTSHYTILVKIWINRFRILYYIVLSFYIVLFLKNRKYRSKLHLSIFILLCIYPLIINHIMIEVLKIMDTIFSYTPANAYRNLFNQNINKLEKNDIYLHYTQIPL